MLTVVAELEKNKTQSKTKDVGLGGGVQWHGLGMWNEPRFGQKSADTMREKARVRCELENGCYRERLKVNAHLSSAVKLHGGLYSEMLNINIHLSSALRLHMGLYRERLNVNVDLSSAVRLHMGLYRERLNVSVDLSSAVRLHTGLYR